MVRQSMYPKASSAQGRQFYLKTDSQSRPLPAFAGYTKLQYKYWLFAPDL